MKHIEYNATCERDGEFYQVDLLAVHSLTETDVLDLIEYIGGLGYPSHAANLEIAFQAVKEKTA